MTNPDKPNINEALLPPDMQEQEEKVLASGEPYVAPTEKEGYGVDPFQEAVVHMRRWDYHNSRIDDIKFKAAKAKQPLLDALKDIEDWEKQEIAEAEASRDFHSNWLAGYYKVFPPKGDTLTLKLPGGTVSGRNQEDQWDWGKDTDGINKAIKQARLKGALRPKVEPVKDVVREKAVVQDGKAYLVSSDGELIELPGVTVAQNLPMKITVKAAKQK